MGFGSDGQEERPNFGDQTRVESTSRRLIVALSSCLFIGFRV